MIDGLSAALQRIHTVIPEPILEAGFADEGFDISIDEQIKQKVLLPRVRQDMSVRCGPLLQLILDERWIHPVSSPSRYALGIAGANSVYHIPPEAREHRDIASAFDIEFPFSLGTQGQGAGLWSDCQRAGNSVASLSCAILKSKTYANMLVRPTVTLYPGNIIALSPQISVLPWKVHCRLQIDDNFSSFDVSLIAPFTQLCEQAVKAYLYNKLLMVVETGLVWRGAEIGVAKDIVSSYSDANEKYDELLIACGGADIMSSQRLYHILSHMVPRV